MRRVAISFAAWTAIGIFFYTQSLTQKLAQHNPTPGWHFLVSWLSGVYICALAMPLIFWLGRRFPIDRGNWPRRAAVHLIFNVAISLAELLAQAAVLHSLGIFPDIMPTFGRALAVLLREAFHQNFMSYWILLGLEHGWRYYCAYHERRRQALQLELQASELRTQLARAQLSALNMQLHPHFLFNTLNAVMVLVRQRKSREAEEMLGRLSDLLRSVLDGGDAQEIPLRQELDYLRRYLAIEEIRFQDRLSVRIRADSSVLDAAVPYMALQPLVENAIRHGIGGSSDAGLIEVTAERCGDRIEIKVRDDGPGLPPGSTSDGIGLKNTRERLCRLYGDAAILTLENDDSSGAVAAMTLPYRSTVPESDPATLVLDAVHCADRG